MQFWEESDEALLGDLDEEEDPEDTTGTENMTEEEKHNYFLLRRERIAIKNVLANKIAEKLAEEKRLKMHL